LPDIFLSYNREDQATARRFAEAFESQGFSVWWDTTLRAGEAYDEVTEAALNDAKAVVVLWSPRSATSRWVRAEATQADRNKTLVPVTIEACKRPIMFELTQTADLTHWDGAPTDKTWLAFLADVRRFVQSAAAAPVPFPPAAAPSVPHQPGNLSICVQPFANMSNDADQEYFADGISEDIITDLSKVSALWVAARNTAFTFKGKHVDIPQVARQLKVSHVLEGSVRKAGNRVRITAQLIEGETGGHVWADRYDRDLNDIFALQDEIAREIVKALKLKLFPEEQHAIEHRGTNNVEAYDKYLRARALAGTMGPVELMRAVEIYREALALDPGFALAWYGLYSALHLTLTHVPENVAAATGQMEEASQQVVALAPDAWWTQSMRALQFIGQRRWSEAESAARAAMTMSPPSDVNAAQTYGFFLVHVGRIGEAVEYYQRVRRADPLSLGISGPLQNALDMAGRHAEAEAEYQRSRDLSGGRAAWEFFALLRLWSRQDADSDAIEAQFRFFLRHENVPMALNHILIDRWNDAEAARDAIRQAFEDPASQDSTRMAVISIYADHFGDKDMALAAIRRFVALGGPTIYLIWLPVRSGLRADPRFKEIVRDLGLYEYWRASGHWGDFARPLGDDDFEMIG
jgi:adenylate cyclase